MFYPLPVIRSFKERKKRTQKNLIVVVVRKLEKKIPTQKWNIMMNKT